jgi:hypothetical protein
MPNILVQSPLSAGPWVIDQPGVNGNILILPSPLSTPGWGTWNPAVQGTSFNGPQSAFHAGPWKIDQASVVIGVSVVVAAPVLPNPAWHTLRPAITTARVVQAPVLTNPAWAIQAPVVHVGVVESPAVLTNPAWSILAIAGVRLGVTFAAPRISNPAWTILTPATTQGFTAHPAVLANPSWRIGTPAEQTSTRFAVSAPLTTGSWATFAPTIQVGKVIPVATLTNPAWHTSAPTETTGATIPVLAPLSAGHWATFQPIIHGMGSSVAASGMSCPPWKLLDAAWSSVDPYVAYPLGLRQKRLYLERVNVWRKTRNAVDDPVWYLHIGNLPCKMFTSPNRDIIEASFLAKTPGVYLFNRLGTVAGADIRVMDAVQFLGPNQPDSQPLAWYLVEGQPEVKANQGLRRANQQEVYLQPAIPPPVKLVA